MKIFKPADIMLPSCDMHRWSVVACDQFTSEPEYWQQVRSIVGDASSTLHMMLPEAELGLKDPEAESVKINAAMQRYIDEGVFKTYRNSYIYLERTLKNGAVRRGIMGMFDLEAYDWVEGTHSPIRATEHTVEDRLPPRIRIRRNAPLEMPHIMIFMDDADNIVFSSVTKGEKVYDFELMQDGGSITGWLVADTEKLAKAAEKLGDEAVLQRKYGSADNAIIFAMGDGNHSLAAAKRHWEKVKKTLPESEYETAPARYALAELVNIHDAAITFEPIHKVVFDTEPETFFAEAKAERDVFINIKMRKQRILLKHRVDLTFVRRDIIDPHAVKKHVAACGLYKTADYSERGGFSAAGGAEQRKEFLIIKIQVNIV